MTKDDIFKFLLDNGVSATTTDSNPDGTLNRIIEFTIHGKEYAVEWYVNHSTLFIGRYDDPFAASIPFRYIFSDTTFPYDSVVKSGIAFSYTKKTRQHFTDRVYPFEVFRIPFKIYKEMS